jgi:phage shock protein PspC (stress-responsive transcriptional regulator)
MERKKLTRSNSDYLIAGVCGGLAEYFGIDPIIIRLVWLLIILAGGAGVVAYIVAWIIIPEETTAKKTPEILEKADDIAEKVNRGIEKNSTKKSRKGNSPVEVLGYLLVVFGIIAIIENFYPRFGLENFWPILIIIFGLSMVAKSVGRQ